jgi:hypothetical protein
MSDEDQHSFWLADHAEFIPIHHRYYRIDLSNTVISSSGINAQVLTAAAADLERACRVCSPQEKATRWHKERFR